MPETNDPSPMFYLMGASHLTALLRASRAPGDGPDLPQFAGQEPAFRPWAVDPQRLPGRWQVASLYVGHTAPFWGTPLVQAQDGGRLGINPGLQTLLRSIAPAEQVGAVVLSLRGEEYHSLVLAAGNAPFDFHLQERPDLTCTPGVPVLPVEVVQARMAARVAETLQLVTAVRMFCPGVHIVRLAPPPPPSDACIERWLCLRNQSVHPALGLPDRVRLKLWILQNRLLAAGSTALQVKTLPAPPESLDERGLLHDGCMDDPIHGNAAYGALVCRQLVAWDTPASAGP